VRIFCTPTSKASIAEELLQRQTGAAVSITLVDEIAGGAMAVVTGWVLEALAKGSLSDDGDGDDRGKN
jgi:hypothetical protein